MAEIGRLKMGLRKILPPGASFAALWQQATKSDVTSLASTAAVNWTNIPAWGKAELLLVALGQRLTGGFLGPFNVTVPLSTGGNVTVTMNSKPTWQIANIANKWVGIGLVAYLMASFFPWQLPERETLKKTGFWMMIFGGLGGLIDDPALATTNVNQQGAVSLSSNVNQGALSRSVTGGMLTSGVNSR